MASFQVGHLEKVRAVATSGQLVAIGGVRAGTKSTVTLFDLASKKVTKTIELPSHVWALACVRDTVFAGCADGSVRALTASAGVISAEIQAHVGGVTALATSADGASLVSGGADGALKTWHLDGLKPVATHQLSNRPLRAVAVSSTHLAGAGDDGIVHVVSQGSSAQRRDMAGHAGPVYALSFTPRDGRLASAGDDGTIRLWFLDGAIEAEVRGANEQGHAGGAFGLVFGPVPGETSEPVDRLFSVGADAKLKVWRLDERRKPKSFDHLDVLRSVAFAPAAKGAKELGTIVAAGDSRTVLFVTVGADGQPLDGTNVGEHGFRAFEQQLSAQQRPGREAAVRALAALDEPEALTLALKALAQDKEVEVRALAATVLGEQRRRDARAALRERLDDAHEKVRKAALTALQTLETDQPIAALRAGLGSKFDDVRALAVGALPALYPASPLVPGLVAARLADGESKVRLAALDALVKLHPAGSHEPYQVAFERGTPDLRIEAMVRTLLLGESAYPLAWWMTGRALDDDDAEVRRLGFAVRVLTRPALARLLYARFGNFERMTTDLARRVAVLRRSTVGKEVTEAELKDARSVLGVAETSAEGELQDNEFEPLLLAMSSRVADSALRGTVAMLSLLEDQRAVGALLQLSRDASPQIRGTVAQVLQHLESSQAEPRLVAMLEDTEGAVRATAADAWSAKVKGRPLDFARGLLRSGFEDMRVRGLATLVQLPEAARDATAEGLLENAIEDESAKVRAEAFRTLWAWHSSTPEEALDRALSARFADVRHAAVNELATLAKAPRDDEAKPPAKVDSWVSERLERAVKDRAPQVGIRAFEVVRRLKGAEQPDACLLGLESVAFEVRLEAARWAAKAKKGAEALRSALLKALQDEVLAVQLAALESLDALFPSDAGPLTAGLGADTLDQRVRAAELLAKRLDERIIEPMRGLLADKDLPKRHAPDYIQPLRARAAGALATLGSPRVIAFAVVLLKDDNGAVREQAARALCNANSPDAVAPALDALSHADVAVRSWVAEGLARQGDVRGLPVLTGTVRDAHLPIREGAIRALTALGTQGNNGVVAGLDDAERWVQETFFAIVIARDWKAWRVGRPPDLLTAALSSRQLDIRFAAARALELRTDAEPYVDLLVEMLAPARPEKQADMKEWPPEAEREHLMVALADMLSAASASDRYAAGQALLLRRQPVAYFAEVRRITTLKSSNATVVPDTTPRLVPRGNAPKKDWVRRLFASNAKAAEVSSDEQARLRWLAFGAYLGIIRETSTAEGVSRVRRDAIDRAVALAQAGQPPVASVVPVLVRALDDDDHLVRKQAWLGLRKVFVNDSDDTAIKYALTCKSADIGRAALDELFARGAAGQPLIGAMLNSSLPDVRKHAFELLVRLSPGDSLEPLLQAFSCQHADLRLSVVERLAASSDPRVFDALLRALESEHDDLRLRAAGLLAARRDDRAVPVLAAFVRGEEAPASAKALAALVSLGSSAAVKAIASRLDEVTTTELRKPLMSALGEARGLDGVDALVRLVTNEEVGLEALTAGLTLGNFWRPDPEDAEANAKKASQLPPRDEVLLRFFTAALQSKKSEVRLLAVQSLDVRAGTLFDALLASAFGDRDVQVRTEAVKRYATRVEKLGADAAPLEQVLKAGARELMLPAALGLAHRQAASAYRPLLLFVRAGEAGEREAALQSLGTLGDVRCLEELETVASGGTIEVPFEPSMQAAALVGLGRLYARLTDAAQARRVWERVEAASLEGALQEPGIDALRAMGTPQAGAVLERIALNASVAISLRQRAVKHLGALAQPSAENVLGVLLRDSASALRAQARRALAQMFVDEPMRVALAAADSPHADVAAPAIAFLVAEAEPVGLLARLEQSMPAALRDALRTGLSHRAALPTAGLVKVTAAELPAAREDVAWLMGLQALSSSELSATDKETRAKALVAAATQTAQRWAKSLGTERVAEERAWRRLMWAATVHAAQSLGPAAAEALGAGSPAPLTVRREAVRALAVVGGASAVQVLTVASGDRDGSVRRGAVAALASLDAAKARGLIGTMKPLDALALAPAVRAGADVSLLSTDAGRQVALAGFVVKAEAQALIDLAKAASDEKATLAALAALGRMGGDEVVRFLESIAFTGEGGGDDEGDGDEDGDEDEGDEEGDDEGEGGADDLTMTGARRYECTEDGSSKFWEVLTEGTMMKVRFGKIGTAGQMKLKDLGSPGGAQKEMEKMIREKTGKGYEEVKPRGRKVLAVVTQGAPTQAPTAAAWGNEALRKAAFRAFKRASRLNEKRGAARQWFSAAEVKALAQQAASGAPLVASVPVAAASSGGWAQTPLDSLEVSVRTSGVLADAGFETVGELVEALEADDDLGLSRASRAELVEVLRELGAPVPAVLTGGANDADEDEDNDDDDDDDFDDDSDDEGDDE